MGKHSATQQRIIKNKNLRLRKRRRLVMCAGVRLRRIITWQAAEVLGCVPEARGLFFSLGALVF